MQYAFIVGIVIMIVLAGAIAGYVERDQVRFILYVVLCIHASMLM